MPRKRPSARSMASFLESRRSVLTLSLAATAIDAGLTTILRILALVSTRCSTKAENPASYTEYSVASGNHRGKLAARPAGSACTVTVFTICLWHTCHRIRFLVHIDSHVHTLTGIRAALLCHVVFLSREYSQRVTTRSP